MSKFLNKNNARNEDQANRMNLADKENICPFCKDGLIKIHRLPIEKETENFFTTKTAFPYDGAKHQYLIISKSHITEVSEIKGGDWIEIWELFNWVLKETKITGGAMFWRFGDMKKNGSSIAHFHIQVLSGTEDEDLSEEKRESIKVKLRYKKK
jgi:diadenosine tetraphosphate (Ap4A) HIT family hydrolase